MTERKRDNDEDIKEDDGMWMMIKGRKMKAGIMRMMKRRKGGVEDRQEGRMVQERAVSNVT